ncbi:sensor histidine kinase, partial [Pseudomonas syringae pv. actinidiae ICMP 19096]
MDGFKKRLSESVQLRLSVSLSLVILAVAIIAGIFAFVSALDEAHEMQDETLRQVAVLFDRQQMTLQYSKNAAIEGDDEESRVIIQYLADGARAAHDDDTSTPLAVPTTLPDGFSTLDV